MGTRSRGFTLIELLVVLVIVLMVSAVAIPPALNALGERSIQEGAQLVQAAIVSARDEATHYDGLRGIRFVEDPALPGFANRIVPLEPAPDYSEGAASMTDPDTLPANFVLPYPCLMVEQSGPLAITSWAYNVRTGDQIRLTPTGPWYTVAGPTDPANPTSEGFVQYRQVLDRQDGRGQLDYLWLADGVDDDRNGFVDDGFDGIDNNNNGVIDEPIEWEQERWRQPPVVAGHYAIHRRPVPGKPTRTIALPGSVVVDLAGMPGDVLFGPTGAVTFAGNYAAPSSYATTGTGAGKRIVHELKIHLIERGTSENEAFITVNIKSGQIESRVGTVTP